MPKFVLIILWLGVMALIQMFVECRRNEKVCGQQQMRTIPLFGIIVLVPVVWLVATRGNVADTFMYLDGFRSMPTTLEGIPEFLETLSKDKGFSVLSVLIKIIFGNNEVVYLLIIAIIQGASLWMVYRKYSENYLLSIFLFIASTDYVSWMCNGTRQFLAVTVIFATTTLMLKRRYFWVIIAILLASTFHKSALLMLPCVFIAQGKAWNKRTLLFTLVILVCVLYVDRFTNILDQALYDTQYANVVSDWKMFQDDGTNPVRILVYSIPTIFALFGYRFIREEDNPVINFCVNMSMISAGLYIISGVTSGIYMGRLPIYASLYNYILLPWEINHFFLRKTASAVKVIMVILYLMFYYFQMHFGWGYI